MVNLEGKHTLFGTSGIRGLADELFTEEFCIDISKSFLTFLKNHKLLGDIVIGMDPRESGPRIKDRLLKGLSSENITIYDEGITPIPSINWLIKSTDIKAGIMITGSHIAPDRNGLKFYAHDEEISFEDEKEIEKIYNSIKGQDNLSNKTPRVVIEERAQKLYINLLRSLLKSPLPKWKIALDCANGAQSVVMPDFLQSLGIEVIKINCNPNADFIARDTDTDDKAQIEKLKQTVVEQKCDFGVAFDGDGDRVIFIDETGKFITGEYSCGLVAKTTESDVIVTTISASSVVDQLGKKVIRTKVGSPYVIQAMKENNAKFGFEPNGGAISAEVMYTRDGGTMLMKMFNILTKSEVKFSDLFNSLPKFYMNRTKVDYKWEQQQEILNKAKEEFKGIKFEEIDGLKIWLDNTTWILFRSSQNAPEFRVFAESDSNQKSKDLMQRGVSFVEKIINKK